MKWIFTAFLLIVVTVNAICQNGSVNNKLNQIAVILNKNIPIQIDSNTRVDSVIVLPEDTLVYKCTLLRKDLNPGQIKNILEQQMTNAFKHSPNFKGYSDYNVSLRYDYYNDEKLLLFSIFITPDKYKH